LPDHRHPAQPVRADRQAAPRRVLAGPGQAAAASAVRDAGRGRRLGHAAGPVAASGGARRGRRVGLLRQQLVADRAAQFLLRPVRARLPGGPPVVPGGGGAVLPDLAVTVVDRGGTLARAARHRRPAGDTTRPGSTTAPTPGPSRCEPARLWLSSGPAGGCAPGAPMTPGWAWT